LGVIFTPPGRRLTDVGQERARLGHACRVAIAQEGVSSTSPCSISRIHGSICSPFSMGSPMFSQVMGWPRARILAGDGDDLADLILEIARAFRERCFFS